MMYSTYHNNLLNLLISKTVTLAIEKGVIRSKSIIVDATHTLSRSNPFSAIEVLRERSKQLRKTIYMYDEEWKDRMPKKNVDNDLEKELAYCKELKEIVEKEPSISSIPAIQEKLNIYEGAQHAFHNDTAPTRYNEAAAKLAWQRTIDFFGKHLSR